MGIGSVQDGEDEFACQTKFLWTSPLTLKGGDDVKGLRARCS